jgi:hypothetical protein
METTSDVTTIHLLAVNIKFNQLIDILTVEDKLDHTRDFPRMNSHELGSATTETPSEIVRIFVAIRKKPKKGVSVLEGRTNVNHIFETQRRP